MTSNSITFPVDEIITGLTEMDNEHVGIYEVVRRLHIVLKNTGNYEITLRAIDVFLDAVAAHCQREERLMDTMMNAPQMLRELQASHAALYCRLRKLRPTVLQQDCAKEVYHQAIDALWSCLHEHFLYEDAPLFKRILAAERHKIDSTPATDVG